MPDKRRLRALLGLLGVLAAILVYTNWTARPTPVVGTASPSTLSKSVAATASTTAPDVRIAALKAERPRPGTIDRNLFAFKSHYVPPPPPPVRSPAALAVPSGPPPAPPAPQAPPIPLKFIGVLEQSAGQRVAILSDGRGAPMYGKEGEALLGQYRILRIGAESIELEYVDGRGRQAIRLSGS
ncbi:MAG: hypothetical protein ABL961_11395 [Vicinamibacterales bacterium]